MTEEEFWALVAKVKAAGGGDLSAVESHLKDRLERLDADAVQAFGQKMYQKWDQAYSWPLWAAAYIIHGGCSDDAFMDFRSSLIFLGRENFESALANPDSLADQDDEMLEDLFYEGLFYVAHKVYEAKAGTEMERGGPPPVDPSGQAWDEDDEDGLKALCPKLFQRFW